MEIKMKLGDNVKYTDEDNNEILAVIQAKTEDGKVVISLPGGISLAVDSSDLDDDLDIS